ncbi:hypothetical protein CHS0354_035608 [Potamilus streckersoni]|uniref:Uncharacterized protein n=1 Tax=Potamilus streckersoni TaxID=2493646 RepID=A0AAE0RRQ3_9BIVA|nr:hypothetical protein CHS0354_035608 [Potamilus streckersoni]
MNSCFNLFSHMNSLISHMNNLTSLISHMKSYCSDMNTSRNNRKEKPNENPLNASSFYNSNDVCECYRSIKSCTKKTEHYMRYIMLSQTNNSDTHIHLYT